MTEEEWLTCVDCQALYLLLRHHLTVQVSERKLRLLALAFLRKIRDLVVDDRSITAFAYLDRHAEHGLRRRRGRPEVAEAAWRASLDRLSSSQPGIFQAATAVAHSLNLEPWRAAEQVMEVVIVALAGDLGPQVVKERARQLPLQRDIFGNLFRPVTVDSSWQTATVTDLAAAIYTDRAFDRLPILADALEDAGCTNADILYHCRQLGEHVRGCWVVDLVLGKS